MAAPGQKRCSRGNIESLERPTVKNFLGLGNTRISSIKIEKEAVAKVAEEK